MLTAATADADVVVALEAGANDYITKPFRFPVVLARIRAHLRVHEESKYAIFIIGPYTFRPADSLILDHENDRTIRLTGKETDLLKFIYRSGDIV